MKYLNLFFKKSTVIGKWRQVERVECKKQNWKIFILQWDTLRIKSDRTPIGLHAEGGKSNLSNKGP